jgi:predicted RNA binding protein YcfA (HicA-like mRNA interferase family)
MKVRDITRLLEQDGWVLKRTKDSQVVVQFDCTTTESRQS